MRTSTQVTLAQVAEAAGVDTSTVSRALAGHPKIAPGTAARIRQCAETLGYVPNHAAGSLRTRRTRTVALVAPDLSSSWLGPLLAGAEEALRAQEHMLLAANAGGTGTGGYNAVYAMLSCGRVDGVLITSPEDPHAAATTRPGVPVVAAGHESSRLPYAAADVRAGAMLVTWHLAGLGHHVAACVGGPWPALPASVLAAAARHGGLTVPRTLEVTLPADDTDTARREFQRLLAGDAPCSAVIAGSDIIAAGCYTALAGAGRPCPAVSVTGFGDQPLSASLVPPLTTVRLPQREAGIKAARLLLELITVGGSVKNVPLTPALQVRDSTAAPV